jgi:hypothetical protein
MFDTLSDKLEQTVKRLRGHGKITERNVEDAVRDVRLALLEADVQLDIVRDFTERVRQQSLGAEVLASLTPEQHFIKIVRSELTALMGGQAVELNLSATPPVVLMLVGLNGAWQDDDDRQAGALAEDPAQAHALSRSGRRLSPGRHRAAHDARRSDRRAGASDDSGQRSGRRVSRRRRGREEPRLRCRATRHRRPSADRRRADGGARAHRRRPCIRI